MTRTARIRALHRDLALDAHDGARITGGEPALLRDPRRGFRSFGEFAQAVKAATPGSADERLRIIQASAPSTFGSTGTGVDGGFAVPPDFASEVGRLTMEESLIPACDTYRTDSGSAYFPTDRSTPWGTSGVLANWQNAEGVALTQVKPLLTGTTLKLNKLVAFVPVSQELWEDSAFLADYLTAQAGAACAWRASDAIIKGLGSGMPLGFLNAGALVVQAKDAAQATNTITATNVSGMLGKLLPGSLGRAIWLVDSTALQALAGLSATNFPMHWAQGDDLVPGTRIPSLGRLAGRPVIVSEHMNAFSSQGDIALVDLMSFRVLLKNAGADGVEMDFSLDCFFDAYAGAFRFRFRFDGQPKYSAAITTPKGGTASPFVTLAAR